MFPISKKVYSLINYYVTNITDAYQGIQEPIPKEWSSWYSLESEWLTNLSNEFDIDKRFVAACCAVFSINQQWPITKSLLEHYLQHEVVRGTGTMKNKISQLKNCNLKDDCILSILNGDKISNFYMNLMYPDSADYVTIDRHAARIAGETKKITSKKYHELSLAYMKVADRFQILPNRLQSITWSKLIYDTRKRN